LKRSNRLVLLIGIFLAIVAFVLVVVMLGNGGGGDGVRPSASPTTASVVVATKDINLGERIEAAQVGLKDIPIADEPADSYGDTSLVIGQIARAQVTAGQIVTSAILNSSGSIGNIEVPKGFVAMSVKVDQTTGVGTIVKPGDFVDLVTGFTTPENVKVVIPDLDLTTDQTYAYKAYPPEQFNETTVKVLAQGLQVLGTLLPPPPTSDQPEASGSPAPAGTTVLDETALQIVILAVPTQDAEVIKFSQIDGEISLVLRSSEDCTTTPIDGITYCPTVATTGITLRRLVDDRGVLPPAVVQVIQPTPLPGTLPKKTPKP
jgi:Flp pilus assembly protein CpaB